MYKKYKKHLLFFMGVLFIAFGFIFPMKTAKAGNAIGLITPIFGIVIDPGTGLVIDYLTCGIDLSWNVHDCANPQLIDAACGDTSSPPPGEIPNGQMMGSRERWCASGVRGQTVAQSGGIWDWYCMGINGGDDSGLCQYIPPSTDGECGDTTSASEIYSCASGTLGAHTAQGGGIYDWYCMGINGGRDSSLCRYTPPSSPVVPIVGECGDTSLPSGINTCAAGTLGENHAQSGGIYDWYCMGLNGGAPSPLCRYIPGCNSNCDDAGNYCSGESYTGNCDQTCTGTKYCPPGSTAPSLTLSADPNPVDYNTASTLYWTVSNATWCWGEPFPTVGWKTDSGSDEESTGNLTGATTFTLECGNDGPNTVTRSVTVNVRNRPPSAPDLTLTARPNPVSYNTSSTLFWRPLRATACWASGDWGGWKDASNGEHREPTGNLTEAKTYRLECWNDADVSTGIKSVTVNIINTPSVCGNGIVEAGEQCDLGADNGSWPSLCSTSCTTNVCPANCNDSDNYCIGERYVGNCGQWCWGTQPNFCENWSGCNKLCGGGMETQRCSCPNSLTSRACNSQPCPPGYREVTPW